MLLPWWAAVYPAICLVNTHLNIHSEGGGEQTEKINHSLWWASDPREVPDPSTKNLFIYHCDTIRHGHPSEKMAERLPFSALSSSLARSFSPLAFSGRIMHWESDFFFSLVFFHFGCENVSFLDGHGEKRTKRQKDSKQKSNKGPIGHAGRSRTVAGQFTYAHTHGYSLINIMKRAGWMESCRKQEGRTGFHQEPKKLWSALARSLLFPVESTGSPDVSRNHFVGRLDKIFILQLCNYVIMTVFCIFPK